MEEMKARADDGFLLAQWCESTACEARIKEETGGVTSRNRPFNLQSEPGELRGLRQSESRADGLVQGVLSRPSCRGRER